ncbi:histidine phosphatase family protein [Thermobifida halotolerans]|uniref:Histidine phosphatase family protein n=1 Tax=Thermobifida halotolerans TaxID=483545 RepID=A0A399G5N1_9ACTN|nr:histidine phosphatase family protein [Thermobifida halotolerans]UOE20838.1 histidine phosphatase family protein [Thermobifida halotolerans]
MPVIYLVRHGQASYGTSHYDVLSDLGRRQAEVVGAELARRGLRSPLVVCGTLRRQRDTAETLMGAAGLPGRPRTDPRWNEYDHVDIVARHGPAPDREPVDSRGWQPLLDHALRAWIEDGDEDGWHRFSTGAAAALDELVTGLGPGRDAVVVTSGGVLAALCAGLLSMPAEGVVALNRVAVNAAITTVTAGGSGAHLLSFNDHAHFTGERRALLTYR